MEKELFNWEEWEQIDTLIVSFDKCVLNKDCGSWKKGSMLDKILMDYEHGKMTFYLENAATNFNLKFLITEEKI